jgi:hypothetical protein
VRESPGDLALRDFDSLPASAGLTNAEAFRLSIRHALTLLPAMLAKGTAAKVDSPNFERFRLL